MNVVIKIDECEVSENYQPLLSTPADLIDKQDAMSTSMRNFVNTYGIAVQKAPSQQHSGPLNQTASTGLFSSTRKNLLGQAVNNRGSSAVNHP